MLMQMLHAGGISVLSDGVREQDEDNPRGYYEHQAVAALKKDNSWLGEARGKVVKVITQLLQFLPNTHCYKVVFIQRPLDEVLMSQAKMLDRLGKGGANLPPDKLKGIFLTQLDNVQKWLADQSNFEVLYLQHSDVIREPLQAANSIAEFLESSLDCAAMAAAVDPSLYRNCAAKDS